MHSMGSKPLRTILEGHRTGQVALHLSGSRSVDNSADFVWVCDECGQPVSSLTNSKLTRARDRHIAKHHAHVPRDRFHCLYEQTGVVIASTVFPWAGNVLVVKPG